MLKFDTRFKYKVASVIIDFGPDDVFRGRTTPRREVLLRRWLERKA